MPANINGLKCLFLNKFTFSLHVLYVFSLSALCTHPFHHLPLRQTLEKSPLLISRALQLGFFFFLLTGERDEMKARGEEGASQVEEKRSENELKAGEDRCADINGADISDVLVSLVTAGASFVKGECMDGVRLREDSAH